MFFSDFQASLIEGLRIRVRNGQVTERGLAKMTGASQPHIHNILKGARGISPELGDAILQKLQLSLLDFIGCTTHCLSAQTIHFANLPVLQGRLGPGHVWPSQIEEHLSFQIPAAAVALMWRPVAVRLAEDVHMQPLFADGDFALLDQSRRARVEIIPDAHYAVKRGRIGLIRRLKRVGNALYMMTEDTADHPGAWEKLPTEGHSVSYFVRARAVLIARDIEWESRMPMSCARIHGRR